LDKRKRQTQRRCCRFAVDSALVRWCDDALKADYGKLLTYWYYVCTQVNSASYPHRD